MSLCDPYLSTVLPGIWKNSGQKCSTSSSHTMHFLPLLFFSLPSSFLLFASTATLFYLVSLKKTLWQWKRKSLAKHHFYGMTEGKQWKQQRFAKRVKLLLKGLCNFTFVVYYHLLWLWKSKCEKFKHPMSFMSFSKSLLTSAKESEQQQTFEERLKVHILFPKLFHSFWIIDETSKFNCSTCLEETQPFSWHISSSSTWIR